MGEKEECETMQIRFHVVCANRFKLEMTVQKTKTEIILNSSVKSMTQYGTALKKTHDQGSWCHYILKEQWKGESKQ